VERARRDAPAASPRGPPRWRGHPGGLTSRPTSRCPDGPRIGLRIMTRRVASTVDPAQRPCSGLLASATDWRFRLSVPVFSNDPTSDDTQQATRRLAPGRAHAPGRCRAAPPRREHRPEPDHRPATAPTTALRAAARRPQCLVALGVQDRPQRARTARRPRPVSRRARGTPRTREGCDKGTIGAAQGHPAPNLPNLPPPRTAYREPPGTYRQAASPPRRRPTPPPRTARRGRPRAGASAAPATSRATITGPIASHRLALGTCVRTEPGCR